ncbi:MAG: SMP-30/gluconolactonase/LRE family protein [Terriglobales bacterium]
MTKLTGSCHLRMASYFIVLGFSLSQAYGQPKVTTVAGGAVQNGKPATSAALTDPHFAAYDKKGNLYISDEFAHRVRKVSPSGIITTVAGNGISGYGGDGGPAKAAIVSFPTGLAFDTAGNVYFSDSGNQRVRKIDTHGKISTIAGNGTAGFGGDGGLATAAELSEPWGLAFDAAGNLYIGDVINERVRIVNTSGVINTFAGNGTTGFGGDGGPATAANLNFPYGLQTDGSGNLYIADLYNYRIRIVNAKGTINTFAGNGNTGCSGDGGSATAAAIGSPTGLTLDGNSLLMATQSGCGRIRAVDLTSNTITTIAGSGGGYDGDGHAALSSKFAGPSDVKVDPSGNVVIVDRGNGRVREVNAQTQIVSTIAGGFTGDGGKGTLSNFNFPDGMGFDSNNNLYIADSSNHRVRKLAATGTITTIAGTGVTGYSGDMGLAAAATLDAPQAVAADTSGNVFIADQAGAVLREVSATTGKITTFSNGVCYSGSAPFCAFSSLATDASGNVYGADPYFCAIWQITPSGTVTAVAGAPDQGCGYNSDGIPATQALLNSPFGVALDSAGNIYIGDQYNNRVRKVDHATKLISTVAGNGTAGFSGDGGPATAATLNFNSGVAVDSKGNLYIADLGNSRVRVVNSSGTIETYAGTGSFAGYNGNGLAASATNFDYLNAVVVNTKGIVYVLDTNQCRARKIH